MPACFPAAVDTVEEVNSAAGGQSQKQEELLGSGEALDLENSCVVHNDPRLCDDRHCIRVSDHIEIKDEDLIQRQLR
ncbi:hypothetical protein INR49_005391, partial [Caranx melampygus]